ncbi:MAG: hypothetical protein IT222_00535 [Crocinitomix sp.]|jgi:hypothetical protein|nr:hypothetical protein [Crocinitomix sp.]
MWTRATWHECASELKSVSEQFQDAYWNRRYGHTYPRHPEAEKMLVDSSQRGVEILRSLALAIRSEQDFDIIPDNLSTVGLLKTGLFSIDDISQIKMNHGFNGHSGKEGYANIRLRECLNKIAHANPNLSGFYVSAGTNDHDIILTGENRGRNWLAIISLNRLIDAVKSLQDFPINRI